MNRRSKTRRNATRGALALFAAVTVSACSSDGVEKVPESLPAVCQVLDDDVVRQAVGADADVVVERNRDDGDTECRYVARQPGLSALYLRLDTPSAGGRAQEAVESMSCSGGERIADPVSTYCPNTDSTSYGPFLQVAVDPDRVAVLSLSLAGSESDSARAGLVTAAAQVVDRADTLH